MEGLRPGSSVMRIPRVRRNCETGSPVVRKFSTMDCNFDELHFREGQEEMVFAGEIVEEGAFADVGGVGDVFDGGIGEAALGEKIEGGAEKALADLSAAALAATVWKSRRVGHK